MKGLRHSPELSRLPILPIPTPDYKIYKYFNTLFKHSVESKNPFSLVFVLI